MNLFISRIAAALVSALTTYLAAKGIELSQETQLHLTAGVIALLVLVSQLVYAITHKLISKRTNPGDAASGVLRHMQMEQRAVLKAKEGLDSSHKF